MLPGCAKCARTQLECLGYKKPLVWNKGVASRGKMMGKNFPVPTPPQSQSQSQSQSQLHVKSSARQTKSRRIVRYDPAQTTVVGDIAGPSPIEASNSEEEDVDRCGVEGEVWGEGTSPYSSSSSYASSPDSCGSNPESLGQIVRFDNIKCSLSFIKPCFLVDLDATDRYYLDYCKFLSRSPHGTHMWKVFFCTIKTPIYEKLTTHHQSINESVVTSSSSKRMATIHTETSCRWPPKTRRSFMQH